MVGLFIRLLELVLTLVVIGVVCYLVMRYLLPQIEVYIARYNQNRQNANNNGEVRYKDRVYKSRTTADTTTSQTKRPERATSSTKSLRPICPECTRGYLVENNSGGVCNRCGSEFSKKQVQAIRNGETPTPLHKPAQVEHKRVEISLDDVKIGWLETTFLPHGNVMKRGSIDAYYLPDPANVKDDRFVGYFDDWDTAHAALEKAYYQSQHDK
jgi:hypothetical protein